MPTITPGTTLRRVVTGRSRLDVRAMPDRTSTVETPAPTAASVKATSTASRSTKKAAHKKL